MDEQRFERLFKLLRTLSPSKLALIEHAVERHTQTLASTVAPDCPPFNKLWVEAFGDSLQTHHAMSQQNLGKDRFEYALIEAFEQCKIEADDSGSRTRQGYDVKVQGVKWSLKTQSDKGAKPEEMWISKFMEMGKGKWETAEDLPGLRDRFLHHMQDYDRIFTLRHWLESPLMSDPCHFYELVEIPKTLMQEAEGGEFEWMMDSKQNPKPGYCRVSDKSGGCKFELYFDGGTERKLQVKHLQKKFCKVVATWKFLV